MCDRTGFESSRKGKFLVSLEHVELKNQSKMSFSKALVYLFFESKSRNKSKTNERCKVDKPNSKMTLKKLVRCSICGNTLLCATLCK